MESEQPKTSNNTPLKLFIAQVNALFKKHMLICFRNKSSLLKELLLPMITSVSIYTSQFSQDVTMPIQILFPISLMGHVRSFMVDIVHEKSEKYREYLKINGVSSLAYIFSMLLFGYLKALIFTIVTCSSFVFIGTKTFELEVRSVLILYFLTAIACTHFALLITAFFSSKQLCSDVGGFIFTILSFLFVIAFETGSKVWYYISLIFPQNGLAYALFNPVQNKISINAGELIAIATLDAIVFLVVFLYLDQILPDVYGVRKSPFFCIRLCYRRRSKSIPVQAPVIVTEQRSFMETDFAEGGLTTRRDLFSMEQVEEDDISSASYHQKFENPAELKRTIFLENISKSFGHEKIIDDLSLMIYERQIFCLLGHNGAGKTTTINLLTGLLDYKNGEIHYQDLPFRDNMSSIRKTLGLCGQQDILYPDLTVEEHMQMMGQIRGDSGSKLNLEIQATMHRIGLEAERSKLVKTLSGGNKRKLSLGLAVLGDVRIVFLDEPTSGMDPNTRRSVWNLIKGLRDEGKTIVLTTHHLDEADELSDRIGVMSKGKLFAVGSSDFIKRKFGVGYHLIITPDYERNCTIEHFESLQPRIFDIVHQFIESANQEDQGTSAIIKFMLPFTYQKSFPQMFEELEKINNIKLNLKMNSLEDAFINIGMHDDLHFEQGSRADANQTNMNVEPPQAVKEHTPKYIFMYQLEAMFLRKYFFTVRNYKNIVLIISPIIFVILGTMATVWRLRSLEDNETEQRQGDDLDHSHDRINQGKNDQGEHGSFESTTSSAQSTLQLIEGLIIMMFLFFVNFAYSFNATVYCVFPVYERENKIAYSLRVMGCRDHPYWLGTFTFDFLAIQLINVTLVMLVYIFEIKYLQDDIPLFIATVMSYSSALITTSYFWGFVFQNSNTVFKSYAAFYLFALYCLPSAVLSLLSYYGQAPSFSNAIAILIFHICPNFAFNDSVKLSLGQSAFFLKSRQQCVIWLLWLTFFYVIGAILIQKKRFKVSISQTRALQDINPEYSPSIDFSEMASEANRIRNPENQDPLKIQNLNKTYKNGFKAIKDLSFGIKNKEIFGLLGPNGAGKKYYLPYINSNDPSQRRQY